MAKKIGRVTRAIDDGWAMVVTDKGEACSSCEVSQICDSLTNCMKIETKVLNHAGACAGDHVSIHLSSKKVLKGAFLLYLIPTLCLLIGAIIGASLSSHLAIGETGTTISFGFVGFLIGLSTTAIIDKRISASKEFAPVITRVIGYH